MRELVVRSVVVVLVTPATVMTLVRLLGADRGWLATAMTVLPWLHVVALLGLVVALLARWAAGAVVTGVVVAVGLVLFAPRVLPDGQPDTDGPDFVVLVANLREGRADAGVVVQAVRDHDVDLLVTPELTDDSIARLGGAGLDELLDAAILSPSRITSGIGVWTSSPAVVVRERVCGRGFSRGNVDLVLAVDGAAHPVAVTAVHPLPPINPDWTAQWADTLADVPGPADDALHVVAGDLNATLDHSALRDLLRRGYEDAAELTGDAWRTTFDGLASGEPVPPVTIDHVLVDPRVATRDVTVLDLPDGDHRMLLARLQLPSA